MIYIGSQPECACKEKHRGNVEEIHRGKNSHCCRDHQSLKVEGSYQAKKDAEQKEKHGAKNNEEGGEVHRKGESVHPQLVPRSDLSVVDQLQSEAAWDEGVGQPDKHISNKGPTIVGRLESGLPKRLTAYRNLCV